MKSEQFGKIIRAIAITVVVFALLGLLIFVYRKFVILHPDPTLKWAYHGTTYELLNPRMLGAFLVAPFFLAVLFQSLADLPWQQRFLALAFRWIFVALIALSLARFSKTTESQRICTIYYVDVSDSMPDDAILDAKAAIAESIVNKPKDAVVKIVTFAVRPKLIQLTSDGVVPTLERHSDDHGSGAGTNLQAALQLGYGLYPPGYLKRAVVFSDGAETDGSFLAEISRAKSFGIRVFAIPSKRPPPAEVAIEELRVPDHVKVGETFQVTVRVYSTRKTNVQLRLFQGEALNGLDGIKKVDLVSGGNTITFQSVARIAGPVTYRVELDPIAEDRFPQNNRYTTSVDVPGRPSVLYVDGTPQQTTHLANALTAQQFEVDVRPPSGFPTSIRELERFDFVILSDAEKASISMQSQDAIETYVRDLGGGFLFAGGESGYGLGGWYHTTIERILPVRMESDRRKEIPSVAMALVIDRSGSMTGVPLEMAKAAAKATATTLSPDDLLEVIAFDSIPTRYVKMQLARNRTRISNEISKIQPGGGTEIFSALDAAYQDMMVTQARKKHVILLTDGKAPSGGIRDLVSAMIAESITVTTVGLGAEVDDALLKTIADVGGGRFHAVADPNHLPKIFTKETEMISRAAAVEEWFPVVQVGSASFLRTVDVHSAPLLHGYVSTKMKSSPAQELLQSELGEPILARWRVGLGWSLAWTSDVKAKWAVEWLRWAGFEKFWGQLVHEHMRQKSFRELDMKANIREGVLHAFVDAYTLDERFENNFASKLTVTGPEPGGSSKTVDFIQTAPGRYEATMPLSQYGSYLLKAQHSVMTADGSLKPTAMSSGHVSNPYPREYGQSQGASKLLEQAALATEGVFDNSNAAVVFDPRNEKISFHEDLWSHFLFAAIAIYLLDLLVRRVRIFNRKFVHQN